MEERQYEYQTPPMDYFQQWYHSTQQFQPQPVPQYSQMVNTLHQQEIREDRIMSELVVYKDLCPVQANHSPVQANQCPVQVNQCPVQANPCPVQVNYDPIQANYGPDQASQPHQLPVQPTAVPSTPEKGKKRGRPPKQKTGEEKEQADDKDSVKKAKRTLDRFNGMSVEEVMARKLPDIITYNLDILIIGINPGLLSAYKGRHYPNPGNHFWKCLFLSGFTPEQLNYMHDQTLPEKYGIGFTNMVERTTPGSKDLSNKEIREGASQLLEKLQMYRPQIAAFNGKGIYEIFCKEIFGVKAKNLEFGLQPYKVPETETVCYLMPSSSPRCAQFPRAQDKVHFYIKLKELRDQLKGVEKSQEVLETQYTFDLALAKDDAKRMSIKEEQHDPGYDNSSASGTQQACSFYPANRGAPNSEHSSVMDQIRSEPWTLQPFEDHIPDIGCPSNNRIC